MYTFYNWLYAGKMCLTMILLQCLFTLCECIVGGLLFRWTFLWNFDHLLLQGRAPFNEYLKGVGETLPELWESLVNFKGSSHTPSIAFWHISLENLDQHVNKIFNFTVRFVVYEQLQQSR